MIPVLSVLCRQTRKHGTTTLTSASLAHATMHATIMANALAANGFFVILVTCR